MTGAEVKALLAAAKAAYPREVINKARVELYCAALADIGYAAARAALAAHIATSRHFPTVAELRYAAAEAQLALPDPVTAYDMAMQYANTPVQFVGCADCNGIGFSDAARDTVCATCRGQGIVPLGRTPLPPPVQRALEHVGGARALAHAEQPTVVRGQFQRAYATYRDEAVRQLQLPSNGAAALPTGIQLPELPSP